MLTTDEGIVIFGGADDKTMAQARDCDCGETFVLLSINHAVTYVTSKDRP